MSTKGSPQHLADKSYIGHALPMRSFVLAVAVFLVATLAGPVAGQTSPSRPDIAYPTTAGTTVVELGDGGVLEYPIGGESVSWSPDAAKIAVVNPAANTVHVIDIPNNVVHLIATNFAVGEEFGGVSWFDSAHVAVATGDNGTIDRVAFDGSARQPILVDPDVGLYGASVNPFNPRYVAVSSCERLDGFCGEAVYDSATNRVTAGGGTIDSDWLSATELLASEIGTTVFQRNILDGTDRAVLTSDTFGQFEGIAAVPGASRFAYTFFRNDTGTYGAPTVVDLDARTFEPLGPPSGLAVEFDPTGDWVSMANTNRDRWFVHGEVDGQIALTRTPAGPVVFPPTRPQLPLPPPVAEPDPAPPVHGPSDPPGTRRLAGPSRIETAAAISADQWGDQTAAQAVLTRADDFADALAATPLAAKRGPLLLTNTESLPPATRAELVRVLATDATVFLAGGTAAIDDTVAAEVQALGFDVVRLAGATRIETADAIATEQASRAGSPATAWLINGVDFADGLIAGWAAATTGGIVLIGDRSCERPAPDTYVVGSLAVACPDDVTTIAGGTVLERSVSLATQLTGPTPMTAVATAEAFPDGLTGGAHAATAGMAFVLVGTDEAGPAVGFFDTVDTAVVYGGTAAVTTTVTNQLLNSGPR